MQAYKLLPSYQVMVGGIYIPRVKYWSFIPNYVNNKVITVTQTYLEIMTAHAIDSQIQKRGKSELKSKRTDRQTDRQT